VSNCVCECARVPLGWHGHVGFRQRSSCAACAAPLQESLPRSLNPQNVARFVQSIILDPVVRAACLSSRCIAHAPHALADHVIPASLDT
jgi:hypothetical protein